MARRATWHQPFDITFAASARQSPQDIWTTTESSFDPDEPGEIGQELVPWQELLPRDVFDRIWEERGASMLIVPRETALLWLDLVRLGHFG